MSRNETGPLAAYNSLTDPNLAGYFTNRRLRQHLRKSGLVTRDGMVVSETTYRMYWTRRQHQQQMHEILANAILNKTLDMERTRQSEIRKKIDEISKIELVRRMREDREQRKRENTLPLLTPRNDTPSGGSRSRAVSRQDNQNGSSDSIDNRRTQSAGPSGVTHQSHSRSRSHSSNMSSNSSRDNSYESRGRSRPQTSTKRSARPWQIKSATINPYDVIPDEVYHLMPTPPQGQKSSTASARRRRLGSAKQKPSQSPQRAEQPSSHVSLQQQVMNQSTIKMHYFGPSLKIDSSFDGDEQGDMILVEQQPAGSGTLNVFRGYVKRDSTFSFESRRYRTYPFSLTLYINGQQDCRLSACCEHKHKPGARLGGRSGHFGIVSVSGSEPCYKCQFEEEEKEQARSKKGEKSGKSESKKKKKKEKQANDDKKKSKKRKSERQKPKDKASDQGPKISVDNVADDEEGAYEDDFEDTNNDKHSTDGANGKSSAAPERRRHDSGSSRSSRGSRDGPVKPIRSADQSPERSGDELPDAFRKRSRSSSSRSSDSESQKSGSDRSQKSESDRSHKSSDDLRRKSSEPESSDAESEHGKSGPSDVRPESRHSFDGSRTDEPKVTSHLDESKSEEKAGQSAMEHDNRVRDVSAVGEHRDLAVENEVDGKTAKKLEVALITRPTRRPSASSGSSASSKRSDGESHSSYSSGSSGSRKKHRRPRRHPEEQQTVKEEVQANGDMKGSVADDGSGDLFAGWDQSDTDERQNAADDRAGEGEVFGGTTEHPTGSSDVDQRNEGETADNHGNADTEKEQDTGELLAGEEQLTRDHAGNGKEEPDDAGSDGARKHSVTSSDSAKNNGELFTETFRVFSNGVPEDKAHSEDVDRDSHVAHGSESDKNERDVESSSDGRQNTNGDQVVTKAPADVEVKAMKTEVIKDFLSEDSGSEGDSGSCGSSCSGSSSGSDSETSDDESKPDHVK